MPQSQTPSAETKNTAPGSSAPVPSISLPKGGGAIRGIGEKFAANPVTGTGLISVPITSSPGRSGFGSQLSLYYDSSSGNGPIGFGWGLLIPSITRKTDKGPPHYFNVEESETILISGVKDLSWNSGKTTIATEIYSSQTSPRPSGTGWMVDGFTGHTIGNPLLETGATRLIDSCKDSI